MVKDKSQRGLPLYEALLKHQQREKMSVHVPGHKNGLNWPELAFSHDFLSFDQTEVEGLDYLHAAEGVLKESQILLSALHGSEESYFLVNGSTVGILSMILGSIAPSEEVLVMKNAHQSVFNGLAMADAQPIFLTPEMDTQHQTMTAVSYKQLAHAIATYPEAKALILTYPNYYGQTYDLKKIIDLAHQHDILVLVDEAHGAHFLVSSDLPETALSLGADIVVQSAHKMLPAMTQAAYLHIRSQKSVGKIPYYLAQLQSSSPSYLLMLSLDIARHFAANFTSDDWHYTQMYNTKWQTLFTSIGLHVYVPEDQMKMLISHTKVSGTELARWLAEDGLDVELSDEKQVLITLPLLKVGQGKALPKLDYTQKNVASLGGNRTLFSATHISFPKDTMTTLKLSYRQQKQATISYIPIKDAVGYILAENLTLYPPGIPLRVAGEMLTEEDYLFLQKHLLAGKRIVGIDFDTKKIAVYLFHGID